MPNPNTPIVNAGVKYVENLILSYGSASTLIMSVGSARDNQDQNDIIIGNETDALNAGMTTLNALTVGVNGLDAGAIAASTNYYVFIIGDSTKNNPSAFVISASNYNPQLPVGYDIFRRVGCARTDGSSNFYKWFQYGRAEYRDYYYDVGLSVLAGGAATSFTNVSLTSGMPSVAYFGNSEVLLQYTYTPASATNQAEFSAGGSSVTSGSIIISGGVAVVQKGVITVPSIANVIRYKVSNASDTLSLSVIGFKDYLGTPQ